MSARDAAVAAIAAALSFVLSFAVLWQAPAGGQVSLEPLPILVLALWRGVSPGVVAGTVGGLLHWFREPLVLHPLSIALDYALAGALLGLAGMGRGRAPALMVAAVCVALVGKYLAHVVSGYLLFSEGRTGWAGWTFSALYNGTYMAPQLLLQSALAPPVARRLTALRP